MAEWRYSEDIVPADITMAGTTPAATTMEDIIPADMAMTGIIPATTTMMEINIVISIRMGLVLADRIRRKRSGYTAVG